MEDTPKTNKKKSETPTEDVKNKQIEEPQQDDKTEMVDASEPKIPPEDLKEDKVEEKSVEADKQLEEKQNEKSEESGKKDKEFDKSDKEKKQGHITAKEDVKKQGGKKKDGKKDDFKYIVRIANTDIDGDKSIVYGLASIKGIGIHLSVLITDATGIDRTKKIGNMSDSQIEKIKNVLENATENAPRWMLNHRNDYETGEDIHLIGSEIDMKLRDEINVMKKIRSYKGIRHELGLPVRGQRTRANNRKGLSLGVSKKAAQKAASSGTKE